MLAIERVRRAREEDQGLRFAPSGLSVFPLVWLDQCSV